MNYKAKFTGREVGAIGITSKFETIVTGTDEESATLNLYERFEHISGLELKETIETNWFNIDLDSESDLPLIDELTFDTLLLEINCNIKDITPATVRAQFLADLNNRIEEAKSIFESNLNNIVNHAKKERK